MYSQFMMHGQKNIKLKRLPDCRNQITGLRKVRTLKMWKFG